MTERSTKTFTFNNRKDAWTFMRAFDAHAEASAGYPNWDKASDTYTVQVLAKWAA